MIQRIGQNSAEANTVTIPTGHQAGDLMVIFAFRDGSVANPSIPAGWTNVTNTFDGTLCSVSIGYKIATSSSETSGTWTNATGCMVIVLRNANNANPVMITGGTAVGTTNTVNYVTLSNGNLKGATGYYIFSFVAHTSINTTIATVPPTGMTNILNAQAGATQGMAIHEAASDDTWPTTAAVITGTASGWQSAVIAIRSALMDLQNYKSVSSGQGNTGIISIGEKVR